MARKTPESAAVPAHIRSETVPDWGRKDSKLVLIGEAPGFWERARGQPFIGPSGKKLSEWWSATTPQLSRSQFFITNILDFQPIKISAVSQAEMRSHIERLHETIASLTDPWVLVPTGNTALRALTTNVGITRWRGSILAYKDRRGRIIKVIPTIHPSQILRTNKADDPAQKTQPIWERACRHDWQRIAEEQFSRELNLPKWTTIIDPDVATMKKFEAYTRLAHQRYGDDAVLATDIETPGRRLYCVGFAIDEDQTIVINWRRENCRSDEECDYGRALIKRLWENDIPKAGQNVIAFDAYFMEKTQGIRLRRLWYDTMAMHHCLDPSERHSLEYLASIYLRIPFWKLEGKEAFAGNPLSQLGHQRFVTYCGTDCIATRQLVPVLKQKLESVAA